MVLLDTSFLIAFEEGVAADRPDVATAAPGARRSMPVATSIVALSNARRVRPPARAHSAIRPSAIPPCRWHDCASCGD
jgi:hypothetical protein